MQDGEHDTKLLLERKLQIQNTGEVQWEASVNHPWYSREGCYNIIEPSGGGCGSRVQDPADDVETASQLLLCSSSIEQLSPKSKVEP